MTCAPDRLNYARARGDVPAAMSPPTKAAAAQPAAEVETDGTARLLQTRHTDGVRVSTQLLYSVRSGVTLRDWLLVETTGNITTACDKPPGYVNTVSIAGRGE